MVLGQGPDLSWANLQKNHFKHNVWYEWIPKDAIFKDCKKKTSMILPFRRILWGFVFFFKTHWCGSSGAWSPKRFQKSEQVSGW